MTVNTHSDGSVRNSILFRAQEICKALGSENGTWTIVVHKGRLQIYRMDSDRIGGGFTRLDFDRKKFVTTSQKIVIRHPDQLFLVDANYLSNMRSALKEEDSKKLAKNDIPLF